MKKTLLSLFILFSLVAVVYAQANIAVSLKECLPYAESGTIQTEGMDVTSTKQILGKQGDRCVYKETISFSGMNVTTTCKFTQSQVNEITSVMNAYSLLSQYSAQNVDTSSLSGVKDNPVVKVWNKYLQDSSTCTLNGLNGTN